MQFQNARLSLGIDIGSTTVKYALVNDKREIIASRYERHKSAVVSTLKELLSDLIQKEDCGSASVRLTGSGALVLAQTAKIGFVQEVVAAGTYLRANAPLLDAAVELGGEDAKIIYLTEGVELRMNEACAGGTGAFIDQMASLLDTDPVGLNELAKKAKRSHPIASRCGVFAKTDVVALLNSGVPREEIARSIFEAVADQAIRGLACGRPIIPMTGGAQCMMNQSLQNGSKHSLRHRDISTQGRPYWTIHPKLPQIPAAVFTIRNLFRRYLKNVVVFFL